MELIRDFKDLGKNDAEIAGGKGASLGEMTQAGIPVPPGFVVLAGTFEKFLEETDLNVEIDTILHSVDPQAMHTVENASEKIQALIKNAPMPEDISKKILDNFKLLNSPYVAVRSSATAEDSASAAWAGQLDSYLNTTKENLLERVQDCWASLFTPRAIFYRFEKDLHKTKISVAVVVQKMVNSEKSGIAFSVHPVTEDYNQIIIEAGFGLGEAIVSGQITPDSYVVEKEPRRIIDINIAEQDRGLFRKETSKNYSLIRENKRIVEEEKNDGEEISGNEWKDLGEGGKEQVLSGKDIMELTELIIKIENHYGFPCDIEWAYACPEHSRGEGKFYIVQSRPITTLANKNQNSSADNNSNEKDEWIFMWAQSPILPSFYASSDAQKNRPDIPFPSPTGFQYFDGKVITMYMPKSELERTKHEKSHDLFLRSEDYENFVKTFEKEYREWIRWIQNIKKKDYSRCGREELIKDHEDFTSHQRDSVGYFGSTRTETNHAVEQKLEKIVEKQFGNKWPEVFGVLTTPLELDDIQKQQLDLAQLAEKDELSDEDLLQHASEFPWLVFGQFDDQKVVEYVKSLVDDYDGLSHKEAIKKQEEEKKRVKEEQEKLYKQLEDEKKARHLATVLQEQAIRRMDIKDFWIGSYFLSRNLWRKIAEELNLDIWDILKYIFPLEVQVLLKNELEGDIAKILEERKKSYAIYYSGSGDIQLFTAEEADTAFKNIVHQAESVGEEIKGQTAVLGKYKGKVRKVMPGDLDALQKDTEAFQKGEVLVTTMTQPNMVSIMKKAGAIVTDEGGITSHAAIMAREFKIPCIVGCLNAMQVLKDGDLVEVDAEEGVVKILYKNA